jgi:hypothetical protein
MDRDERKLDVFLTFHRSSLLISDMKIFLPFTINLDPYIKKKIKEEQQSIDEEFNHDVYKWNNSISVSCAPSILDSNYPINNRTATLSRQSRISRSNVGQGSSGIMLPRFPSAQTPATVWSNTNQGYEWQMPQWSHLPSSMEHAYKPLSAVTTLPVRIT